MILQSTDAKVMLGFSRLLKDTCSYQKCTGVNKYNEKQYEDPITIKCLVSYSEENTMGEEEQMLRAPATYYIDSTFKPSLFDMIDEHEIISIKPIKGLVAPTIGYTVVA